MNISGAKKDEGWWYPYLKSTNGRSDFSRIACSHSYNMMGTHEKLGSRFTSRRSRSEIAWPSLVMAIKGQNGFTKVTEGA